MSPQKSFAFGFRWPWGQQEEEVLGEAVREVRLKANGPLALRGGARGRNLEVKVAGMRTVRVKDGVAEVRLQGPGMVRVPPHCAVVVERVNGPLTVKDLPGALRLERVNGPVTANGVGEVALGRVNGPVNLRRVSGGVSGAPPRGGLGLHDVAGDVRLDAPVRGAVTLRNVRGSVDLQAKGALEAFLTPQGGQHIALQSDGVMRVTLAPTASARLVAEAQGELHADLPDATVRAGRLEYTLGQGEAVVELKARGDLWVGLGEPEEAAEPEAAWDEEIWQGLEAAFHPEPRRRVRVVGREADEENVQAERLTVLRLLAEKKITAEEADRLLQALEGEG